VGAQKMRGREREVEVWNRRNERVLERELVV
jgi:hypothetical protein